MVKKFSPIFEANNCNKQREVLQPAMVFSIGDTEVVVAQSTTRGRVVWNPSSDLCLFLIDAIPPRRPATAVAPSIHLLARSLHVIFRFHWSAIRTYSSSVTTQDAVV